MNLSLNNDKTGLHARITDESGRFLHFPGVVDGPWKKKLVSPFRPVMEFTYSFGKFENGKMQFFWVVQPDGWYYADSDGFGAEDDEEVELVSYLDLRGRFTRPFEDREIFQEKKFQSQRERTEN